MSDTNGFDVKRMFKLSDNAYDILNYLAVVVLPALGTLYFGLAGYWNLPNADAVVGSIVVVDTFLGFLLRASKSAYESDESRFDGSITVTHDEEGNAGARVLIPTDSLASKDELRVQVHRDE